MENQHFSTSGKLPRDYQSREIAAVCSSSSSIDDYPDGGIDEIDEDFDYKYPFEEER